MDTKKSVGYGNLMELLTTSNSSFQNISYEVEKCIFDHPIIDNCPLADQKENVELEKNFQKRFIISACITGMAIIEYVLANQYETNFYKSELENVKEKILPNIIKIRTEVQRFKKPSEFGKRQSIYNI